MNDEIKGLVERLREERDCRHEGDCQNCDAALKLEAAASLLTLSDEARVRAEASADFWLGTAKAQRLAQSADKNASEALVRDLLEGLRPFGMLAEKWGIDDPNWDDDDIMLFANREGRLSEPPLLLVVGDFRKAQALILRAEGEGSSVADIAAPVASQPGCSAAQSLDGGEG